MGFRGAVKDFVTFGALRELFAAPPALASRSWDLMDMRSAPPANEAAPLLGRSARWAWSDDEVNTFVRDSFRIAGVVFRSGTLIADAFAESPLRAYQDVDGQPKENPNHWTRELFSDPNPEQGEAEFWNVVVLVAFINGFALIEKVRARDGSVVQLYPRTPDSLKRKDRGNGVYVWEQRSPRGELLRELPDADVFSVPYQFDPGLQRRGITPVAVLGREIGIDVTLTAYLKSFIDDGGIPPFYATTKDPFIDEAQPETMRMKWGQKFGGGEAWRSVPFLSGVTLEKVGLDFDEMAFPELKGITELRIAQALGVPAHLLGAKEAIQNGGLSTTEMEQAMAFFQLYTITPLRNRVDAAFTRAILREREPDRSWSLEFDVKRIRALQEDETKKQERVRANAVAGLITLEEARPELGFPDDAKKGETFLRPFSVSEVIAGEDPAPPPTTPPPPVVPPADPAKGARRYRGVKALSAPDLQLRASVVDRNRKAQGKLTSLGDRVLRKFWAAQGERIAGQLGKSADGIATKEAVVDAVNWDEEKRHLTTVLSQFYETAGKQAFDDAGSVLGVSVDWSLANPNIHRTLDRLAGRIVGIADTTKDDVARVVADGLSNGDSLDTISGNLKSLFEETYKNRAMTVARTESMNAYNAASVLGYQESGVVDQVEFADNPDHDTEPMPPTDTTCADRNGLLADLKDAQGYIDSAHPNCQLAVLPVVTLGGD